MFLTYRYRLSPTRGQERTLRRMLEEQRQLYNAALEQRITAYRLGKSLTLYEQMADMAARSNPDHPWLKEKPKPYWRGPLVRLDRAYKAFFSRLKKGDTAGFPRFQRRDGYDTICFSEMCGVSVRCAGQEIRFKGMPGVLKVRRHRALPQDSAIKGIQLTRVPGGWDVLYQVEIEALAPVSPVKWVGVDVGLEAFATLSDGSKFARERHELKSRAKVRRLQKALSKKRGSKKGEKRSGQFKRNKAELSRAMRKVANQRKYQHHTVSAILVRNYDMVALEDLNIKGLSKGVLAKSVHDAGWSRFIANVSYKAEKWGKAVRLVNPRYTSQACSSCGDVVKKSLSVRRHVCMCGCNLDRDHNAAINILKLAQAGDSGSMSGPEVGNVGPLFGSSDPSRSERRPKSGEGYALGLETQPFMAEAYPSKCTETSIFRKDRVLLPAV